MNNTGEIVLPCPILDDTLSFFIDKIGFQLESIFPADEPREAVITGFGVRLRLKRGGSGTPGVLYLNCDKSGTIADGETNLTAPNGTQIVIIKSDSLFEIPKGNQSLTISRLNEDSIWKIGRAGMQYRDLIPGRQGGRFIASHIRILDGGPVPDYVHFHKIRFQMIYCYKGWAKVVYEDQGHPFIFNTGDCVLQPSGIRHQVLENSSGFEVIEISCPAEHLTIADNDLTLPTNTVRKNRDFMGQRFVHHKAKKESWFPWRTNDFECSEMGIAVATDGLAHVKVIRPLKVNKPISFSHKIDFHFIFLLSGAMTVTINRHQEYYMGTGDSMVIPSEINHSFSKCSNDLEFLEVVLPEK
jgi:quercetin dioxygenase-like cupin family protein